MARASKTLREWRKFLKHGFKPSGYHPCEDTADTVAWKSPMAATVKDDATQALAAC